MSRINSNEYNCSINEHPVSFRSQDQVGLNVVTKPIDKVENIVTNTVDTFVPEPKSEEKKKSHKTAIRVGSTVLVLSAIVALLNPKFSTTLVNKLKTSSTKAGNKAKVDNSIWGKWNKFKEKFLEGVTNIIQVLNNANSVKDELFKKICNKTSPTRNLHKGITKCFDKISRQTVFRQHKNVRKQMDTLDAVMKQYKNRLSEADKKIFDEKLTQIDKLQEYFSISNTKERLDTQEKLMNTLEEKISNKINTAKDSIIGKIKGKNIPNSMKFKDTYNFWAEEALMPERNKLEEEGNKIVNSLVGDGKTQKGAYREMIDILSQKLSKSELDAFEDNIKQAEKILRKANKTECIEYFDKKRDLILGSAPTDVVTALASLIASGIAIGAADNKQDRISRTISGALPVFAGLGVSTVLTALLYSGGKGMALGAASSVVLSGMGSMASHKLFPKNKPEENLAQNTQKIKENNDDKNITNIEKA